MTALQRYRQQILALARQRGAQNVRVFGSFARDEQTKQSDIDLLVCMEQGRSLLDLIAFLRAVRELTGREVDVVDDRGISPYLKKRILSEAVPL